LAEIAAADSGENTELDDEQALEVSRIIQVSAVDVLEDRRPVAEVVQIRRDTASEPFDQYKEFADAKAADEQGADLAPEPQ